MEITLLLAYVSVIIAEHKHLFKGIIQICKLGSLAGLVNCK